MNRPVPRLPASPNPPEAIDLQPISALGGASSRRSIVFLSELLRLSFKNAPPKLDTGGEESSTTVATSDQPTGLIVSRPGGKNGFNPKLLPEGVFFKDESDEK